MHKRNVSFPATTPIRFKPPANRQGGEQPQGEQSLRGPRDALPEAAQPAEGAVCLQPGRLG